MRQTCVICNSSAVLSALSVEEYVLLEVKVKVKLTRYMPSRHRGENGGRNIALSILDTGDRMEWVDSATPRPLYPRERDPVPTVQEAGWSSG
jgi:hypothetical protein